MLTANVWQQILAQQNHVHACACDGCNLLRAATSGRVVCVEAERLRRMEAFAQSCIRMAGYMVNGNRLERLAREALAPPIVDALAAESKA